MTFSEFEHLPAGQQAEFAVQHGVLLIERIIGNFNVVLYEIDNFYIELVHDTTESKKNPRIGQMFKDSGTLTSFLQFDVAR